MQSPNPQSTNTVTEVVQEDGSSTQNEVQIRLTPTAAETETRPRVQWATDTVDNENMGKKKSKCCCIYKKKRNWDDSSDEDEGCESEHCRGHVEKHRKPPGGDGGGGGPGPSVQS